jgi:hypothetical protein
MKSLIVKQYSEQAGGELKKVLICWNSPARCRKVQTVELLIASDFLGQQNIVSQTSIQQRASYIPA